MLPLKQQQHESGWRAEGFRAEFKGLFRSELQGLQVQCARKGGRGQPVNMPSSRLGLASPASIQNAAEPSPGRRPGLQQHLLMEATAAEGLQPQRTWYNACLLPEWRRECIVVCGMPLFSFSGRA